MIRLSKKIEFFIAIVLFVAAIFMAVKLFFKNNYREDPSQIISLKTPFSENLEIKKNRFPDKICAITDYGAKINNKEANTLAIEKAVSDCSETGGGTVSIPEGQWLTGAIKLKSNINLRVAKGAEVLFSTNLNDYLPVVFSRYEGVEYYNYSPPIYAADCQNVAITGEGKINGQAEKSWWRWGESFAVKRVYYTGRDNIPVNERVFGTDEDKLRPSFIQFVNCDTVSLSGVEIANGPMWTVHFVYSQNIHVKKVKIETSAGQGTDGIVVDSSRNVLIEDSSLSTGDDAIVIKSGRDQDGKRVNRPSENIVIRNCQVEKAHASFAVGSEVSGGIKNVFAQNLSAGVVEFGVRLKSAPGRGSTVENIWVNGMSIKEAGIDAIQIDGSYENPFKKDYREMTEFKNINIYRISAKNANGSIYLRGAEEKFLENIFLEDIEIKSDKAPEVFYTKNLLLNKIRIRATKDPVFKIKNGSNIKIEGYNCPLRELKACFSVLESDNKSIEVNSQKLAD